MRRFWLSTEYWLTAVITAVVWYYWRLAVNPDQLAIGVSALLASYVISRTLWKKNRGQFHSGVLTSELQALLVAQGWIIVDRHVLTPLLALVLLVANQAIYNVCRGITKSIGVKTQVVHV